MGYGQYYPNGNVPQSPALSFSPMLGYNQPAQAMSLQETMENLAPMNQMNPMNYYYQAPQQYQLPPNQG
jgi:hypothetical protein